MDDNEQEYTEFRLTDDEYLTVLDALSHCRENAIHGDGRANFNQAQSQFMHQHDHHADDKTTISDRF